MRKKFAAPSILPRPTPRFKLNRRIVDLAGAEDAIADNAGAAEAATAMCDTGSPRRYYSHSPKASEKGQCNSSGDAKDGALGVSDLILYTSEDGKTRMQLRVEGQTIWLTQLEIAELFQTTKNNVSIHTKNIFEEGELTPEATVKESLTVQTEGNRRVERAITYYNLDLILAIGYRVRSARGTQFRQWATTHLREYLVKGFVMDDQRLRNPGGWDYFDELLERIREIRASEKRLTKDEIDTLNRLVVIFLEQAELRVKQQTDLTLDFWRKNVDRMLESNDQRVLKGAGKDQPRRDDGDRLRAIRISRPEPPRSRSALRGSGGS